LLALQWQYWYWFNTSVGVRARLDDPALQGVRCRPLASDPTQPLSSSAATVGEAADAPDPRPLQRWCVFRRSVTDRFGIVTAEFGSVTDHFGDVTDGRFVSA